MYRNSDCFFQEYSKWCLRIDHSEFIFYCPKANGYLRAKWLLLPDVQILGQRMYLIFCVLPLSSLSDEIKIIGNGGKCGISEMANRWKMHPSKK